MQSDEFYMSYALKLAQLGRFTTAPNPNVGCVIVRNGHIVGEGYHLRAGEDHAEIHALRMAGDKARDATAYITLEPCSYYGRTPPCTDALIFAGISRAVIATEDPNPAVAGRGLYQLKQAGIEVCQGVLFAEAEALNLGFLKRMRTGLPYVQLKLAVSLDGRTAMASGESQWITSSQARQDVQYLRAQSAGILSTSATILADDPALTVRWHELDAETKSLYPKKYLRQPLRIILDSQNRITPKHRVIKQPGAIVLARLQVDNQAWPTSVEQLILPEYGKSIDLMMLMIELAKRQLNSIWVEAGAKLSGALLQSSLVDELILYLAPKLLGNNSRGLCDLPGVDKLQDAPEFILSEVIQIGPDLRLRLRRKK